MSIIHSMKKVLDILKNHKHAVIWTICYVLGVYAILRYLFNFDLLLAKNWSRLLHLELYGFAGMTFGILILAAIPLYIATTTVIVRNKSPLFNIPLPNCLKTPKEPEVQPVPEAVCVENSSEQEIKLPPKMPKEMREGYMRALRNQRNFQYSAFNKPIKEEEVSTPKEEMQEPEAKPEPEFVKLDLGGETKTTESKIPVPDIVARKKQQLAERKVFAEPVESSEVKDDAEMWPLPESFDIKKSDEVSVPLFSDIKFDDDQETETENENETQETEPTKNESDKDEFLDYLRGLGVDVVRKDNLYITEKYALALHNDDDFWVADELDWFAPGKQKTSPIKSLLEIKEQGIEPVLCLGSQNIMDIETLKPQWEKSGIKVLTELSEIENLLTSDN